MKYAAPLLLMSALACAGEPTTPLQTPPGPDAGAAAPDAAGSPDAALTSPSDAGVTSQHRLHRQLVSSPDESLRRFYQLIDTTTGEPCFLNRGTASDGTMTCFPKASGELVYLDAACTRPYVETHARDQTLIMTVVPVRRGARVASPPAMRYFGWGDGQCGSAATPVAAPLFEAEIVPVEQLPHGRLETSGSRGGLRTVTFVSDDGFRVLHDLIDETSGVSCLPGITAEGPRCQPDLQGEAVDEGLLDPACLRLAITPYGTTRVAPVEGRNGEIYLFEVAVDQQHAGRSSGGMCAVEDIPITRRTLHLGSPYPASLWPEMSVLREGGRGLGTYVATYAGGDADPASRVDAATMFDYAGAPCGPAWIDGELRCLPAPPKTVLSWATIYADNRCTGRAMAMDNASSEMPPPRVTVREGLHHATGLPESHVYEVGISIRSAYSITNSTGSCEPYPFTARYFALGARVDATVFPTLKLLTE